MVHIESTYHDNIYVLENLRVSEDGNCGKEDSISPLNIL